MRAESVPPASAFLRDVRIKAAVMAAPRLGFTLTPNGLLDVTARVQLLSGQQDINVPEATNAGLIGRALGTRAEFHSVPGARHFSFLVPCHLAGPPFLCRDGEGFDRAAFHAAMNSEVVTFLRRNL